MTDDDLTALLATLHAEKLYCGLTTRKVLDDAIARIAGLVEERDAAKANERQRILDALDAETLWDAFNDAAIGNVYAACPYRLGNGEMGAYGPNTCHGGCWEEPECVTGGPHEERDEMEAVLEMLSSVINEGAEA